ncbi:MAG: T9SS type A sorting domain-containing protein [Salibacteraceae bacterium]
MSFKSLPLQHKNALTAGFLLVALVLFTLATSAQTGTPGTDEKPREEVAETQSIIKTEKINLEIKDGVKTLVVTQTIDGQQTTETFTGAAADEWLANNKKDYNSWSLETLRNRASESNETIYLKNVDGLENAQVIMVSKEVSGEEPTTVVAGESEVTVYTTQNGTTEVKVVQEQENGEVKEEVIVIPQDASVQEKKIYMMMVETTEEETATEEKEIKVVKVMRIVSVEDPNDTDVERTKIQRKTLKVNSLNLFPNPNDGRFTIEAELTKKAPVNLRITDVNGKVLIERQINGGDRLSETIDISQNGSGIYFLTLQQGKKSMTKKLVVD